MSNSYDLIFVIVDKIIKIVYYKLIKKMITAYVLAKIIVKMIF